MPKTCCGSSVGVIIEDEHDRLLMVTRGWFPHGIAPVAGHVYDEHSDPADALLAEVEEEVGLTVVSSELAWQGRLDNLCASLPASPPGHYWWIYRATAAGDLAPAPGETKGAAWYTRHELQVLADRTCDYAHGAVDEAEFEAAPGLEPVWVAHLHQLGMIRVHEQDLELIRGLYTTPPAEHWLGGRR